MLKRHGSVNSDTKPIERKDEEEEYNPQPDNQSKMQKEEYFIKNACYSPAKSYLCKQNNKRSLLGRKQRSQVARSFPNRYQFSCTNKVTSLFSISCILRIILRCVLHQNALHLVPKRIAFSGILHCVLHQNALHFAANGPKTSVGGGRFK